MYRTLPEDTANLCRTTAIQLCQKSLEMMMLVNYFNPASVQVDSIRPLFSRLRYVCIDGFALSLYWTMTCSGSRFRGHSSKS